MRALFAALVLGIAPAAATAQVEEREITAADRSISLSHSILVPADVAAVWQAISTPEGWKTWAVPSAWRSPTDPSVWETSYNPTGKLGEPGNIRQRFTAIEQGRVLSFQTIKTPQGFPHAEALARVRQRFELAAEGSATRVTLTGSGYGADAEGAALRAFFKSGNRASLEWLRQRFESGPVNWSSRLAKPGK